MSNHLNTMTNNLLFLEAKIPTFEPLDFKNEFIPQKKIIHRVIFSPTLEEYYFTISDKHYEKFDVFMSKKLKHTCRTNIS